MVFLTSIIIVCILYFMRAEGLIYVTIIALVAELLNITTTHALTKSVEKKITGKYSRVIQKYKKKMVQLKKRNFILEGQREQDTNSLYDAMAKIKEYEEKLQSYEEENAAMEKKIKEQRERLRNLSDLPPGSREEEGS